MNKEIIEEMFMTINDYIEHLEKENKTLHNSIKGKITAYRSREVDKIQEKIDKAIDYLEKSKLNQLDTHCKYLYIDFDAEKIENIDELIDILKGGNNEK